MYDAHVMTYFIFIFYFICMNKVETLMYELMYECMTKVPLFAIFFFFSKKNEWCIFDFIWIYAWSMPSCIFFTVYIVWNLFQLISNLFLFLDLWNPSILTFFFEKYYLVWPVYWETLFCIIVFRTLFEWHTWNYQRS